MLMLRNLAKDVRCRWRRRRLFSRLADGSLTAGATLVLSPHPDDETFGCGNLIALKRRLGARVRVIFLTDGEASLKDHGHAAPAETARIRREQSTEACRILGVEPGEIRRLCLPDGAVPQNGQPGFDALVGRLLKECDDFHPAEIVCPHPLDGHADHTAATEAAAEVYTRRLQIKVRLIYYCVWFCYRPGSNAFNALNLSAAWRIDGGPVHRQKLDAINVYFEPGKEFKGIPYCGKLPPALLSCARQRYEIYFDAMGDDR